LKQLIQKLPAKRTKLPILAKKQVWIRR